MVSIHPLAFIIIGAIVTIISHFITTDQFNYSAFFYLGIIFVVYGIAKWFITGMKESRRHKKEKSKKRCIKYTFKTCNEIYTLR